MPPTARILRLLRRSSQHLPASTWWRRSAPACMFPDAIMPPWKEPLNVTGSGQASPGQGPSRRSKTYSLPLWGRRKTISNEHGNELTFFGAGASANPAADILAPDLGDADQGIHPAQARPRFVCDDCDDPA